jgi:Ca-activated chloride channel family protein
MKIGFENPEYLFVLILIPVVYAVLVSWRKRRLALIRENLSESVFTRISVRKKDYSQRRLILWVIAIALLIIAAANPRIPGKKEMIKQNAADIMVALDISNSMLATDLAPSRLARAKKFLEKVIDELRGERIGVILFAGSPYLSIPLTNDYNAAKLILSSASPDMAGIQGTAIGSAIELAGKAFTPDPSHSKGMILLTDGENHDEDAIEASKEAAKEGIIITTIGIGSAAGSMIPDEGQNGTEYKVDEDGKPVISKLNEQLLVDIAYNTKGKYFNISNEDAALKGIRSMVAGLDKGEFKSAEVGSYQPLYILFLIPATILLLIEMLYGMAYFDKRLTEKR